MTISAAELPDKTSTPSTPVGQPADNQELGYRVLDLFCGAGGFSAGFSRSGCRILAGVELDEDAIASHTRNFHGDLDQRSSLFQLHATPRDIRDTDPLELLRALGHEDPQACVDILIGGPPCPAYTRVGRAKLREVHADPQAHLNDSRATLYLPYLDWVAKLKPLAVVMENVPDILNFNGHNLAEEMCEVLEDMGYGCRYSLLNAASYGVPQTRPRFILVGIHESVPGTFQFPIPTHRVDLPVGYGQATKAALRPLRDGGTLDGSRYLPAPEAPKGAPPAVTVQEALSGLPHLTNHLVGRVRRKSTRPNEDNKACYPADALTKSAPWVREHMLGWPGRTLDPTKEPLLGHIIRDLKWRDFRLFGAMEPEEQYFSVYRRALRLFDERLGRVTAAGGVLPEETGVADPSVGAIGEVVRLADVCLEEEVVSVSAVRGVRRAWDQTKGELVSLEQALEQLALALDEAGLELETGVDVLRVPLFDRWKRIGDLLSLSDKPPDAKALRRAAKDCSKAWNDVRRWERRDSSWRQGLEVVDPARVHPRGRQCSVGVPGTVRGCKVQSEELRSLADAAARARPPTWTGAGSPRAVLELATVLMVDLAQAHFTFQAIKQRFVPPYVPNKFPNKWRKMSADKPARTLMAHLGKDSYSHIHFDHEQARPVSIREAARLQSFPDSFRFEGSMNPAFRQIGNAVPPLFAWRLAEAVVAALRPEPHGAEVQ